MGGNMRLRNKKTGEIKEYTHTMTSYHVPIEGGYEIFTPWKPEEWEELEDVKEPLIKDPKIRKAVKAWAEANDIDRVWYECATCWLRGNGLEIYFDKLELEQGNYSITELCGEEGE